MVTIIVRHFDIDVYRNPSRESGQSWTECAEFCRFKMIQRGVGCVAAADDGPNSRRVRIVLSWKGAVPADFARLGRWYELVSSRSGGA